MDDNRDEADSLAMMLKLMGNDVLIAVTGWGQEEDRRRSHESGFDQHMVKPVDPQGLMRLLAGLSGAARK